MKKTQIVFFVEMGFGWTVEENAIRTIGLDQFARKRLSELPLRRFTEEGDNRRPC